MQRPWGLDPLDASDVMVIRGRLMRLAGVLFDRIYDGVSLDPMEQQSIEGLVANLALPRNIVLR